MSFVVPPAGSLPLFVVTGLPPATDVYARKCVSAAYRGRFSLIQIPAATSDGRLYRTDNISQIIKEMATFVAKKRQRNDAIELRPAFIFLLYVPGGRFETLLKALDFAVFPVPLTELGLRDERGQQLRHDAAAVAKSVERALADLQAASETQNRVRLARKRDAILLPPKNFKARPAEPMASLLREMRTGVRAWHDKFEELIPRLFNSETLPVVLKGEKTQYCFQDERKLVFFHPHETAFHGHSWAGETITDSNGARILRGLYRFGAPLPDGFQHDAQFENAAALAGVEFECAERGITTISGSHANIYPNDVVRAVKD